MRSVVYIAVSVLVSGSAVVSTIPAGAQSPQSVGSIATGTRVRITAPAALTPARQAGRLLGLHADSLDLLPDGAESSRTIPLSDVVGAEVSRRRHRATGTGVLIGVLAGGATGGVIGAATYQESKPSELIDPIGRSASSAVGGVLGAVVGGVIGAFVGHAHQSDDWTKVPVVQRAATLLSAPNYLNITPAAGGVALTFGLRFGGAHRTTGTE